ncbi:hypothetical protein QUF50_02580 [Thiotrichales bacterium HSG1]|nr:hypothetical protein [Thiotrichales bacterium HSG1]
MNKYILLLFLIILFPLGCDDSIDGMNDAQNQVDSFLLEINPTLYRTMLEIKAEIVLVDTKINQLYELKGMFPGQRKMLDKSLKQWQNLRKDLHFTSTNTSNQVEAAYVAYKIDEIQGRKKFSIISETLLKEANQVLDNAETTKSLIGTFYE